MNIITDNSDFAKGNTIQLKKLSDRHMTDNGEAASNDDVSTSFRDMFNSSIGKVNDLLVDSDKLKQKMIFEPETVDIHEVMIAGQKAEVSMTFLKSVRDEALKAYRELMNLR